MLWAKYNIDRRDKSSTGVFWAEGKPDYSSTLMLWHLLGTRDYCALVGSSLPRSREVDVVSETGGPAVCAPLCVG